MYHLPAKPSSSDVAGLLVLSVALLLTSILAIVVRIVRRKACYPPGPGSSYALRGLLKHRPYELFARWSEQYASPLVSFSYLGKRVIILNRFEAVDALLNKRSAAFSDRPLRLAARLCGYDLALSIMCDWRGVRFKKTRKQLHDALNFRAISSEHVYFERALPSFLASALDRPEKLDEHIAFFFHCMVLAWTLGYKADEADTDLLHLAQKVSVNALHLLKPSAKFWFEPFSFLRYIPIWMTGPKASSTLRAFKSDLSVLIARSDEYVRKCLESGGPTSFLFTILKQAVSEEEKSIALYSSVSLTGGAFDTMTSITMTFFVAMMRFPHVQRKAHEEIDRVVGRCRLPTAADRPSLVYTDAVLTEVMRWLPPVPLTSRAIRHDEWYEDFLLPRGSTISANIWAMTRDESLFPAPGEFSPERFLATSDDSTAGRPKADPRDVRRLVFGFGRRLCPGQFFADALLWTMVTNVLATMTISSPGEKQPPMPEIIDSAIIRFAPFPCKLTERFEGARNLLHAEKR
ncbi:cytochrome P450 [Trametes cingulata]|nr:cytochrome P450 [Trametes cingulata]